ncbi:MAG: AbrB/MazE/SpoVT family DNA-binding domain-containing protein [Sedimentisphaerales bacterium]|nr:AbrB/MazE/SpoVT family DNA-binding domain-containing protein [Sedimentisphaerales bacterium]
MRLIRIGNSKGIRLPKAVIEQAGLHDEIEMEIKDGRVILSSARPARAGWEGAARACHDAGHDDLGEWDATLDDFEGSWS